MNIPKYIHKNAHIALSGSEIINQSKAVYKNDVFIFNDNENVFIYLDNFSRDSLNIEIKNKAKVNLNLISYNSKKIDLKVKIKLNENALLKLYNNFISRRKTKLNVTREFNLAYNSSLILLNNISYKGDLLLNDQVNLNDELANLDIELLNVASDDDLVKITQHVFHKAKKTYSQINNWLISDKSSKLDYTVNGSIEKGNELSNCHQLNKGIILSEKGEIRVEPTLFIDEYNVKASHGAAIGQIDENQLFYLLSRGLSQEQAKSLIISGYINPFLNKIKNKSLESQVKRRISSII